MSTPNRATLWGRVLVDELAKGGLDSVCIAPGSRSTPLAVAFAEHPNVDLYSHLDERSAGFFALGRGRRTGEATALVCTSGTAAANFHPSVIEASQARVPLLVLTADRPPELRDSGANQTIDQVELYGDAVRWYAELPEPRPKERTVRMLRTTAARALLETSSTPAGPVHLNCPFAKPLEPVEVPGDVPDAFNRTLAGTGRGGPFVRTESPRATLDRESVGRIADALDGAMRPLIVAGPADPHDIDSTALTEFAGSVDVPILADPLSGVRFGTDLDAVTVCGGYDTYVSELPAPDVVLRIGASPTSKPLRHWLQDADARQFLIDPAGKWREASFTVTDLVAATPDAVFDALFERFERKTDRENSHREWDEKLRAAEGQHWSVVDRALSTDSVSSTPFEGAILATVLADAPEPSTVFVSNSMPVRDADRFGRPRGADLTVLANRGASGIDGITSTALGAGSATDDPLILVTGDLAFYHDSNGLLAIERCDVDATIVVLDNDGGGIFHMLPIEEFDPPFSSQFKTPHGLDFEHLADLYDIEFEHVDPADFRDAYRESIDAGGTQVLVVEFDAESSHRQREELGERIRAAVSNTD